MHQSTDSAVAREIRRKTRRRYSTEERIREAGKRLLTGDTKREATSD